MANKYEDVVRVLGGRFPSRGRDIAPYSDAQLKEYEDDLGYRLPPDYREFLRYYGGISLSGYLSFPVKDSRAHEDYIGEGCLSMFQGIHPVEKGSRNTVELECIPGIKHILSLADDVTEIEDPPRELLLIATDGSDLIYLALAGLRPGAVFLWKNWADIYLVADSFDEFMHLIQPAKS